MMGDPLGSSRVNSQKQKREGVVGAQSEQYRATLLEQAREVVPLGRDVTNYLLIRSQTDVSLFLHLVERYFSE